MSADEIETFITYNWVCPVCGEPNEYEPCDAGHDAQCGECDAISSIPKELPNA